MEGERKPMIRIALLLGLLCVAQEESVESLIAKLGHDDLVVRDQAAAALLKRGETVRPELQKALGDPNVEVRTRAAGLIKKLDVAVRAGKLRVHCGVIEGTGVAWVVKDGFELMKERDAWPAEIANAAEKKTWASVGLANFET